MDSDLDDIISNKIWDSHKCCLKPRQIPHLKVLDHADGPERFFKMGPLLGYGGFGRVYAVKDHANHKDFALKIVDKARENKASKSRSSKLNTRVLEREISLLRVLKHRNIVELFEVYESPKFVYLVLEKCHESLHTLLINRNYPLDENETFYVVNQVATALAYLHCNEIAHRDLKLENILCNPTPAPADGNGDVEFIHNQCTFGVIKLSDFGIGACRGRPGTSNLFRTCCGTPQYMAPEVLAKKPYNHQCDIWSLGVVTFYCLIGMAPFPGKTQQDVRFQIQMSKVTLKGKPWALFSEEVKSLIKKMLAINPEERCTANEILQESWTN